MVDAINKRTNKLLREAISRAQQAFKGSQVNLALRTGESLLKGGNFVGIKSKEIVILAVDTNANGHYFDAKDRIIVSAAGTTAILDHKCKIIHISKDNELAEKIKRASKMVGTGQSGVPEELANSAALRELSKILLHFISALERPAAI